MKYWVKLEIYYSNDQSIRNATFPLKISAINIHIFLSIRHFTGNKNTSISNTYTTFLRTLHVSSWKKKKYKSAEQSVNTISLAQTRDMGAMTQKAVNKVGPRALLLILIWYLNEAV